MKLSILVDYLEYLESAASNDIRPAVEAYSHQLTKTACDHSVVRYENYAMLIDQMVNQLNHDVVQLQGTVRNLQKHIHQDIARIEKHYLAGSFQKFLSYEIARSKELSVLERKLVLDQQEYDKIANRVRVLQNWVYPGLIVRPGNCDLINDFRTDPIYVLDYTQEQIEYAVQHLTPIAQQRLCRYTINETPNQCILAELPDEQLGISVLFYYLNFRPMEIVRQWLDDLWLKTRTGGRVLFTYNDCDHAHGVSLYESGLMSYTPGASIRKHARALGFEIAQDYKIAADSSLMELCKPGPLISQRACQTVARVLARPK